MSVLIIKGQKLTIFEASRGAYRALGIIVKDRQVMTTMLYSKFFTIA
jgi:hypothetical protein